MPYVVFSLGTVNCQHAAFGDPAVVMKFRESHAGITAVFHQTGQYPNTIPEQGRILRGMDIAFHTSTINANFAPLFDFFWGIANKINVDTLPCRAGNQFDIFIQSRFFKSFIAKTDSTKPTQGFGINCVKCQILIGVAKKHFNNSKPQHLISAQTIGAFFKMRSNIKRLSTFNILHQGKKRHPSMRFFYNSNKFHLWMDTK